MTSLIHLSADDILAIHWQLVELFRDDGDPIEPAGPRDQHLLASAASRPHTSLAGIEKYTSVEAKAAALFHSLVTNHPFHNGNKRTALVSLLAFLDRNGRGLMVSDDELFEFVLSVADNQIRDQTKTGHADEVVELIKQWLRVHVDQQESSAGGMSVADFSKAVESAGGKVRQTGRGGSWIALGPSGKSLRFSKSTKRIDGGVVKNWLTKLGLSEGQSGIRRSEFERGISRDQSLMRRFRGVLRRLAKYG